MSTYVEITNPLPGGEYGGVEVTPEGKAIVRAGTFSHGQGHATTFAMLVADRLGIDLDDIEFMQGDTDEIRFGQGTMGSRSLQTAGPALGEASDQVIDQAREVAAQLLEASRGRHRPRPRRTAGSTWPARRRQAGPGPRWRPAPGDGALRADVDYTPKGPSFPFGAHVAVVEVDTETGRVRLERLRRGRRLRARSSTRSSPRGSATAASPRAWPRR